MEQKEEISHEFKKLMNEFVKDIQTTFPEYQMILNKYFYGKLEVDKETDTVNDQVYEKVFQFIKKKYMPCMFDILYENASIFEEESDNDTEFLPDIHFKTLWNSGISDFTKKNIWRYLQLLLFMVIGNMDDSKNIFRETSQMFANCDDENLQEDIDNILPQMQELFNDLNNLEKEKEKENEGNEEKEEGETDEPFQKIDGLFKGKIGKLANEIAENISKKINMDEISKNPQKAFTDILSNPSQFTGIMKDITTQLDEKIKSGDVKESEIISEALQMMQELKSVPGMNNLQSMFSKMAKGHSGKKMNAKATESNLKQHLHMSKIRESMKLKAEKRQQAELNALKSNLETNEKVETIMTDDEIVSMMNEEPKIKKSKKNKKKDKNKV